MLTAEQIEEAQREATARLSLSEVEVSRGLE
jgi:hypothetical protein